MSRVFAISVLAAGLSACAGAPISGGGLSILGADDSCQRTIDAELIVAAPMPPSGRITIHKVCETALRAQPADAPTP